MIYFLQSGEDGPIKIGHTKVHVGARAIALQAASPYELRYLGFHEGDRDDEAALHSRFSKHRVRGEWFKPAPEIIRHIEKSADQSSLREMMQYDLRDAVSYRVRKFWPSEAKAAFRDEFSGYNGRFTRIISQWTSGGAAPDPVLIEALRAFLIRWDLPDTVPDEWNWRKEAA